MIIAILAASALLTAVLLRRQFTRGTLPWDMGATFVLVVGWSSQLPALYTRLTTDVGYQRNLWGELTEVSAKPPEIAVLASNALIVLVALALLWRGIREPATRTVSVFGVAAMLTLIVAMSIEPAGWINFATGQPAVLLGLLAAATFAAPSRRGAITGGAVFTLSFAVLGGLLAAVRPERVFMECSAKCSILGEIYTGASTHGNTVGLITAAGLPFVWLAFTGKVRLWMVLYLALNLAASGSRTAMAAAAVTLVALILTQPAAEGDGARGRNLPVLTLGTIGAIVIALILPFTVTEDRFATGRGYLWRLALAQFEDTPFIGAGLTTWNRFYQAGEFGAAAAYSTHNQWVEMLLLGGVVACLIFLLGFLSMLAIGDRSRKFLVIPVLLSVCVLGIAERPLSIGVVNSMTWVLIALVMVSSSRRVRTPSTSQSFQAQPTPTQLRVPTTRGSHWRE
ncbi:O-antigen ligase family protein [Rhodococcus pyridinivorans]|uniref:O-antigen ligase family protein n=1 Tax=Rhodococcus pyridinivorans TaxID=103816 RepID=UPI003448E85F